MLDGVVMCNEPNEGEVGAEEAEEGEAKAEKAGELEADADAEVAAPWVLKLTCKLPLPRLPRREGGPRYGYSGW